MLGVAILIGLARGIVLVMTDGMITDTLLQWMATALQVKELTPGNVLSQPTLHA